MNESFSVVIMMSVVANALYRQGPISFTKMPRVVPDQREKYDNDEYFRKLSRESEIRYTGYRDRPHSDRQQKFQEDCRSGHVDVAFVGSGTNFQLSFLNSSWAVTDHNDEQLNLLENVDFSKEPGKVHLKAHFIMNGVCVVWRGWIDLQRLDGAARLEFDEEHAQDEDLKLREQISQYNHRLRDLEDRQRHYQEERERRAEHEAESRRRLAEPSPSMSSGSSE